MVGVVSKSSRRSESMAICKYYWRTLAAFLLTLAIVEGDDTYTLDDSPGLGRLFDGIGGLSGGGATSRLLVSYPEKQRGEVLDYLFKPNFGASLQILKVEIGGDAQSTDGSESSHMHSKDEENYERGYEWWLMQEAKKRNPDIKLYALSWGFPAWVGDGSKSPYTYPNITASYVIKWIQGAKTYYDLTIDYIGIWNERDYDATYIKTLRTALDQSGLSKVEVVAPDGSFSKISANIKTDADLKRSVNVLGAHYPGTISNEDAQNSGLPLWSSEDYSTYNDDVGAGCWARILNQNYVNGFMTSTISWNLCASYYEGLPFFRDGLMTAVEPWSGHYDINGPIWVSAHTTQFTTPGWYYLKHGSGVGHLTNGGSYVTFFDAKTQDFTIVIEMMSHDESVCIRPSLPPYTVPTNQSATFKLMGSLASAKTLNMWMSDVKGDVYFKQMSSVTVTNGQFNVTLDVDHVYTLSTTTGQMHGAYPDVPASKMFPIPYSDDFENYPLNSEASLFADQSGVFEIAASAGDQYMTQVVPEYPIVWCTDASHPVTVIGNASWFQVTTEVKIRLAQEDSLAFLAAGISKTGCGTSGAAGIYASISSADDTIVVYEDLEMTKTLKKMDMTIESDVWYKVMLEITSETVIVQVDSNNTVSATLPSSYKGGFIGFGTGGFYPAHFDDFSITKALPAN